jgi:hypothetical protein
MGNEYAFDPLALLNSKDPIVPFLNKENIGEWASFKSNTEADFYQYGRFSLAEAYGSEPVCLLYEWMSFNLPAAVYTPDFAALLEDGRMVFVEVKASKKQRHYLTGRYKMRIVSSLNPFFEFCIAIPMERSRNALWEIDRIPADKRLGSYIIWMAMKGDKNGQNDAR